MKNSKLQPPSPKEISNSKLQIAAEFLWEIGIWNFLGFWNLELGT
jgi:hypothetical protein